MIQPPDFTPLLQQIDLDEQLLSELESAAIAAAERAGAYVAGKFGGVLAVEEKDDATRSLVSDADRESQRIIAELIAERFPDHQVLGEEDPPATDPPAPDFVWAVDPIDGTTNFVNALPTYVVSIAALYRGSPVAAALYLPWPNEAGRVIFHARTGGGAWMGDERIYVKGPLSGSTPQHGRVTMIPIGLTRMFTVGRELGRSLGEPRVTGSLCYDLLMVASGRAQALIGSPAAAWDYAGGMLMVKEAGGNVVVSDVAETGGFLPTWSAFTTFDTAYDETPATMKRLRAWRRPVIVGAPEIVGFLASNIQPGRRSLLDRIRRSLLGERHG
ncbi:MAG: inositol monophosphatase [Chloroflexi bacterium]|nr:inositol monophosphatase [Chloroflexota bacterium]